ncbi:MAG: FHA domain-containing protein [Gammaproteobacteria bacterium]|nr:FHA domain-containing protein [Gammaproteobacteria bacterium]
MPATLSFTMDDFSRTVPCKTVLTVGRDKSSDIVLADLMVSRNHAMIRCIGNGDYYLIDGGSSNGSYVNQQRVTMPRLLKHGDRIVIGGIEFLFEQDKQEIVESDNVSMQETIVHDTPEIKKITILVADIRGFTSLSEQIPIRTLTQLMNNWFNRVSDIVMHQHGIVDKFIGDCVFARWEADDDELQTVFCALTAANAISKMTEELNRSYTDLTEELKIGVGINTGAASVGISVDNSALGDAVNVAFRLESATKVLGKDIVMSESAYRHLPEKFWKPLTQKIRVKGKRDPVRIFAVDFVDVPMLLKAIKRRK